MSERKMKDSGIEWIGDIPEEWRILRNKYNFNVHKNIVGAKFTQYQLLSLTKKGIKTIIDGEQKGKVPASLTTYQIVNKNDIVMCLFDLDCSAVFSGISKYDGIISPAYKCFECKNHLYPLYIDYYFMTVFVDRKYKRYAKNVRYSLSEDEFLDLPIIIPPLPDQQRIADFLDKKCGEIDGLTADIEEQIKTLEEYKKSVITEAVTKGLNPNVEMKDSGIDWIGMIPKNWCIKRVKNIGLYRNGLTYSPSNITDENNGTLVLRSSNIKDSKLSLNDNLYVDTFINNELKIKKNDILICSRNGSKELIGKNAIITRDINATFGAFMMIFRCNCPKYMYYILNSFIFKYYLGTFFTSTINQLTGNNFGNMKIVFSEDEFEQQQIVKYLDHKCSEIDSIISSKKQQLETLAEYKKSLIYEYVTGKKEVA